MDVVTFSKAHTFHGVMNGTDDTASHPANIDLACMFLSFLEPEVVVEAGTYKGHFAFAAANILRQLGKGKVYTADTINFIDHLWTDASTITPFIHFLHGDFLDLLKDVPDPIDFGYIDASTLENPHLRWEHATAVFKRLRLGGILMVDDTEGDWGDAKRFQVAGDIHLSQHRGLTIIQKKDTFNA